MLNHLLTTYARDRDCQATTISQYRFALRHFERFCGEPLQPAHFTDEQVNCFLAEARSRLAPYTTRQRRANLLVCWRFGYEAGLIPVAPRKIRKIRRPELARTTWSPEEIVKLIRTAEGLMSKFRGTSILRRQFWATWVRVAYDTALRPSDQFLLETKDVLNTAGRLTIVQRKTGFLHMVRMRPETLDAIRSFTRGADRRFIFPRIWKDGHFSAAFGRLVAAAGLQGTPKKLRSTSATEVERCTPGAAWQHLGHRTPDIAVRHYLGARAFPDRPLPPLFPEPEHHQRRDGRDEQGQHDEAKHESDR